MKKLLLRWGMMLCTVLSITGCATTPSSTPVQKIIAPCQMPQWIAQQLENTPVIEVGQTVTLILPSDQLFLPRTANFTANAAAPLAAVACVLKYHQKVAVTVTGYTNYYRSSIYDRALSRLQAEKVAKVLWESGIDTRLITATGKGNAHPIAALESPVNRRIVVKFMYLN